MGGPGSGTWYRWDRRTTLEETQRLDIRWLHRSGYLTAYPHSVTWHQGKHRTGAISLSLQPEGLVLEYCYRANGVDWESVREVITLYWTPCYYGGNRLWFLCPSCQRRVAILCCRGKWFLCRHCYRLPYASQCESALDRKYRRMRKIRDRLGASHTLTESVWSWQKPKGMHWQTWERLCEQERMVDMALGQLMDARLLRLVQR
jgi:hypothetical protein